MRMQLILNPNLQNAGALEADLRAEVNALASPGVTISTVTGPAPEGTLPLDQVVQFVVEHADDIKQLIPFATAMAQIGHEVLRRRNVTIKPKKPKTSESSSQRTKKTTPKEAPPLVLLVGDRKLELPATEARVRKFLSQLEGAVKPSKISSAPAKAKSRKPRAVAKTGRR